MILTLITNLVWRQHSRFRFFIRCQKYFSISLDHENLIPSLKSCNQTSEASQIHAHMIKTGLDVIPFTVSKLLASCALLDMDYAASIFNQIQNPNLFMFNTMLRGYSICEHAQQALLLFNSIRALGIPLDQFSFISTLKSCARELALQTGLGIHAVVVRCGYEFLINVRNTLLHFYCDCGRTRDAHQLFDELPQVRDSVSWNVLMDGYIHISQPTVVMDLFAEMHISGFQVNTPTVLSGLSACGETSDLLGGESLHAACIKCGFCADKKVVAATITMYSKTGCMDSAWQTFHGLREKDIVLWNCIIDGNAKNGLLEESLALLRLMKLDRVKPNSATLAGLLGACASKGALDMGHSVYEYIQEERLQLDAVLGTALIDMFSKCGFLERSVEIFHRMTSKDVKTWTAMIAGYGFHGQGKNAIRLFNEMEKEEVRPTDVTFLALLSSCSHGGLVAEGKELFERMVQTYRLSPKIEHYGCMIDLLGRAGLLEEAYKLIKCLPIERDATAWRALLAACRVHGNIELGESVKGELIEFNDEHPTDSILLLSTYAMAGRWSDVARMEVEEPKVVPKETGRSSIEVVDGLG
ncbi:pentatricopeptide repeat-containing protein At1g26900, mitochondrial-like [Telopea speciosissima]|uniref:pentatricopeptide repeat-containing protein At1g26900, mitochondrial-like n=1 Tax=Telopea speciosissima TaxID=54955 RepID=UPI001CC49D5D|nr:pentatricopeptide repeat-containing protein At1g26900, mitochondrial-like [Telopea speciosissima]